MPWRTLCGFPPTADTVTLRIPNGAWRPDTVITDWDGNEMFVLLDQTNEMRSFEAVFGDLMGRRLVCVKRCLLKAFWKDGFYFCTYKPNYNGQKALPDRDVDRKKVYPFSYVEIEAMKGKFTYRHFDNRGKVGKARMVAQNPWLGFMMGCCTTVIRCGKFRARFKKNRGTITTLTIDQWRNVVDVGPNNDMLAALCLAYVFDRCQNQPMVTVFGREEDDLTPDDISIASDDENKHKNDRDVQLENMPGDDDDDDDDEQQERLMSHEPNIESYHDPDDDYDDRADNKDNSNGTDKNRSMSAGPVVDDEQQPPVDLLDDDEQQEQQLGDAVVAGSGVALDLLDDHDQSDVIHDTDNANKYEDDIVYEGDHDTADRGVAGVAGVGDYDQHGGAEIEVANVKIGDDDDIIDRQDGYYDDGQPQQQPQQEPYYDEQTGQYYYYDDQGQPIPADEYQQQQQGMGQGDEGAGGGAYYDEQTGQYYDDNGQQQEQQQDGYTYDEQTGQYYDDQGQSMDDRQEQQQVGDTGDDNYYGDGGGERYFDDQGQEYFYDDQGQPYFYDEQTGQSVYYSNDGYYGDGQQEQQDQDGQQYHDGYDDNNGQDGSTRHII